MWPFSGDHCDNNLTLAAWGPWSSSTTKTPCVRWGCSSKGWLIKVGEFEDEDAVQVSESVLFVYVVGCFAKSFGVVLLFCCLVVVAEVTVVGVVAGVAVVVEEEVVVVVVVVQELNVETRHVRNALRMMDICWGDLTAASNQITVDNALSIRLVTVTLSVKACCSCFWQCCIVCSASVRNLIFINSIVYIYIYYKYIIMS